MIRDVKIQRCDLSSGAQQALLNRSPVEQQIDTSSFSLNLPEQKSPDSSNQVDDRMLLEKMQVSIREFNHLLTS